MAGTVYTFILIKVNTFSFIQLKKYLEDKMTSEPIFTKVKEWFGLSRAVRLNQENISHSVSFKQKDIGTEMSYIDDRKAENPNQEW